MLKVHSRCNLACDHCYVYEHADQTWRDRPQVMAAGTVQAAADRIAAHAERHALHEVRVVLHGGEPLLIGERHLRDTVSRLRRTIEPVAALDLRMQSNGIRLSEPVCEVLLAHDVKVGVSFDGDRTANDLHRRYRNGQSSYEQTRRGLALLRLPRYRTLYAGILCTIDLRNDPVEVYAALSAEHPPHVDLLLPHATWDHPPPVFGTDPTPYASWLLAMHRCWSEDGRRMPIRVFDAVRSTWRGGGSGTEALGIDVGDLVVIETDGAWEQPDSMKTVAHGAGATGLNVLTHSADEALADPAMRHRQAGLAALSAQCQACPVVAQCGGGLYAHRHRTGTGFDNPSVYCADLKEFIVSMNAHPPAETAPAIGALPQAVFDELGAGHGGTRAVQELAAAQHEITRALLAALDEGLPSPAAAALATLEDLERLAPHTAADVLAHPFIRPWLVTCLEAEPAPTAADLGRLGAVVAAVAARAGATLDVPVAVRGGRLHLPTLGTVTLPSTAVERVVVSCGPGGFTVTARDLVVRVGPDLAAAADGWQPARTVAGGGRQVLVEDADPYRDCFDRPAADPLDTAGTRAWAAVVADAWGAVHRDAPDYVDGLRAGLRAITPLRAASGAAMHSATARDAFGAVGVAYTADSAALAVMLVHEFQHSKLGAVLDLQDLADPADPARQPVFAVGWREDPRPVEGVLQGTYAHLAVADMWRARMLRGGDQLAAERHRMYRDWTATGIDTLRTCGLLTPAGTRFVARMTDTLDRWEG